MIRRKDFIFLYFLVYLLHQHHHVSAEVPLRLQDGIPDTATFVGRLFDYPIPRNAFSGTSIKYKVEGHLGKPLPNWIVFDDRKNILEGIPTPEDTGEVYLQVKAKDNEGTTVKDIFSLQVLSGTLLERNSNDKRKCKDGENIAMLSVVIDKALGDIPPKQRIISIRNLSGYLGIETNQLTMLHQKYQDPSYDSILASGQGDVKRKLSHTSTVIMWQVGCEGEIWGEKMPQVEQMKQIARDGTLSEVLQLPVIGWHIINNMNPFRERRDILNDGAKTSDEDELNDEDELSDEVDGAIPITTIKPHPHRHNHKNHNNVDNTSSMYSESNGVGGDKLRAVPPVSISLFENEPTSPVIPDQVSPSKTNNNNKNNNNKLTTPHSSSAVPSYKSPKDNELTSSLQSSPTFIPPETGSTFGMDTSSSIFTRNNTVSLIDNLLPSHSTVPVYSSTSGSGSSKTSSTLVPNTSSTTKLSSTKIIPISTSVAEIENNSNKSPVIKHRLRKLPLTAGKPTSFQVPENTFYDEEQGDTRNLKLSFIPDSPLAWIQFNSSKQEVYALPLEEHVSRWMYDVIATDRQGANVSDTLEVFVQHHKGYRAVTHEISMTIQMESAGTIKFPTMVDWQLFVYNKLLEIYGNDGNTSYITVRSVVTNKEPYVFTWTNESLPRNECPTTQLIELLEIISNTTTKEPKPILNNAFGRLMTVKNVTWKGVGHCDDTPPIITKQKYNNNFHPVIRNPIDHLEAIVGELLVFHVPEDTFFDREDGGTTKLKLLLMTMDRTTIPANHWLQFDRKNQEFFGIPTSADQGRKEYQLVCEDRGGLTANDGLEVIVKLPSKTYYSAEFSVLVKKQFVSFSKPVTKRYFIEKLAKIFGDKDASNVVDIEFEEHDPMTTLVKWANRTLGSNVECPEETIGLLRGVLVTDEDFVQEEIYKVMDKDFEILKADVKPTGICEGLKTPLHIPGVERKPAYNGKSTTHNVSVEYLITFVVPLVVIICMLLCAAIIACILYRKRRTGKMTVGSGDEGAILRSKGIPVIFQDELEEKLEPTNKTPIIMKQEKPPLPPPEYQRSHPSVTTALLSDVEDSSPYQPPPPFTTARDSGSNSRPSKPTPTYRMPPPYMPP